MPVTRGTARNACKECSRRGRPLRVRNCLGAPPVVEAMRVPIPAAGRMTKTDMGR